MNTLSLSSSSSSSPSSSVSPSLSPALSPSVPSSFARRDPAVLRRRARWLGLGTALTVLALLVGSVFADRRSSTPADLVGTWSWTTIGGVDYVDTTTGAMSAPSGMSARFTFTADGRYQMFFYVRQQTYGMVTESTTTHEGTVVFAADGSFTMKPKKGHYRGHTGARVIDRAMTAAERKPLTYRWQWQDGEDGRALYLGPSESALSRFTAE